MNFLCFVMLKFCVSASFWPDTHTEIILVSYILTIDIGAVQSHLTQGLYFCDHCEFNQVEIQEVVNHVVFKHRDDPLDVIWIRPSPIMPMKVVPAPLTIDSVQDDTNNQTTMDLDDADSIIDDIDFIR